MSLTQAELEQHPGWKHFGVEAGKHPPMRGWLAVPLVGEDGRNYALLQLSDKYDEADFTQEDERMPGLQLTIEDMVAEGDKGVCRNRWRWRDAASGTPMEFHGFVEWRFEGNRIAERWATVTAPRPAAVDTSRDR